VDPADGMLAVLEHFGLDDLKPGDNRAYVQSVEGQRKAIQGMAHARLEGLLWEARRGAVSGRRLNPAFLDNVVHELFGKDTGDDSAKVIARAWSETAEWLRQRHNNAGGQIGLRKDWGMPQWHDRSRIARAGFAKWRKFIADRLAPEQMMNDATGKLLSPETLDASLEHVYQSIVSDGWNTREPSSRPNGLGPVWKRHADPRFLKFKDSDAWLEYQREFGGPDPFQTMMRHLNTMSRDIAQMEVMGPDAAGTLNWMKQYVLQQAGMKRAGMNANFPVRHPGTGFAIKDDSYARAAVYRAEAMWDHMRGSVNIPINNFSAEIVDTAAGLTTAAMLGGAIFSRLTDIWTGMRARANVGVYGQRHLTALNPALWARTTASTIRAMGVTTRREAVQAGLRLDSAQHVMGTEARGVGRISGPAWSQYLTDRVLTLTGLTPFTQSGRHAFGLDLMSHMADNKGRDFNDLPRGTLDFFRRYGIDSFEWDDIRNTPTYTTVGGLDQIRPTDIENRTTAEKYLGAMLQETERAIPISTVRAASTLKGRAQAGTLSGALTRSWAMVKTWPVMMNQLYGGDIRRMWGQGDKVGSIAYAADLIAGSLFAGAIAVELKAMNKGEDPLPLDDPRTLGAAELQGGGLGIYGDFLFNDVNRQGSGWGQTIAGPLVQHASDLYDLTAGNAFKLIRGDKTHMVSDLRKNVAESLPGASAWPVRLVLDRLVFDKLQRAMDPEAGRAFNAKIKGAQKQGTDFWWQPGTDAPQRGPNWRNLAPSLLGKR
jgi:hypothetical protein